MSDNLYAPLRQWPAEDITPRRNGLDYQGRWPVFADTYPTAPAHLDGAHACSDINCKADSDEAPAVSRWQRFTRRWLVADDERDAPERDEEGALPMLIVLGMLLLAGACFVAWTA